MLDKHSANRIYHCLQLFPPAGLDGLVLVLLGIPNNRLTALPVESFEALREMRVGEVVGGVDPVGIHGAEVLDVQLDEGAGEREAHAETLGEGVGLELELAREHVHEQLDDGVHGRQGVGEEDEADDDGVRVVEAERGVQRPVVDEDGEQAEDVKQVGLKQLAGVLEGWIVMIHT